MSSVAIAEEELSEIPQIPIDEDQLRHIIDGIFQFHEALIGRPFYAYQVVFARRIIETILRNSGDTITGLWSRQSGKTTTVAELIITLAVILPSLAKEMPEVEMLRPFAKGLRVGIFAPIEHQALLSYTKMRTIADSERAKEIFADDEINLKVLVSRGDTLTLSNGSVIWARTASLNSKIEGETFHIVLVDEAQDVDRFKVDKEIKPMLASCVIGNTRVHLTDGRVLTIEDIHKKQLKNVVSVSSNSEIVPGQVTEFIDSGIQPTVRLTLRSGRTLTATPHHPVLVYRRQTPRRFEWRKIEDLKKDDLVAVPRELPFFGKATLGGVAEAHFIGMMVGDGSYRLDGLPRYCSCDDELWACAYGVAKKYNLYVNEYAEHVQEDQRVFVEATFSGQKGNGGNWLINTLRSLGMYGQTGKNKRLSDAVGMLNKEELAALLAGLFDTDGYVGILNNRNGSIVLGQSNRELLVEVQELLLKFGVHSIIRKVFTKSRYITNQRGNKHMLKASVSWKLEISGKINVETFAKSIKFKLTYKQNKLEELVDIFATRRVKSSKHPHLVHERIISIEDAGEQQVFDVVVPGHHSFVGNGIVCHNTNGPMIKIGTANVSRGGFRSDIQYNIENYKRKLAPRNHFEFPYDIVIKQKRVAYSLDKNPEHLAYEKFVNNEKRRYGGEKSKAFRMNFMLMWEEAQKDAFTAAQILDSYDNTRVLNDSTAMLAHKSSSFKRVAGLDVAKINDFTVVTIKEYNPDSPIAVKDEKTGDITNYFHEYTVAILELQGNFEDSPDGKIEGQYTQIVKFIRQWGVERITADETGMGIPVFERLQTLAPEIDWQPYNLSNFTKYNLFRYYVGQWEAGRVHVASGGTSRDSREWEAFYDEHKNLEKEEKNGRIDYHAPINKTGNQADENEYHDDYPVSSALASWSIKSNVAGEIKVDNWANRQHTSNANKSSRFKRYGRRY